LARFRRRAEEDCRLIGAKYTEEANGAVEGAIIKPKS